MKTDINMDMNKKILYRSFLQRLPRFVVGFVFIFAAVGKIIDPISFATDIAGYQLFLASLIPLIAAVIPWIELFCGIALVLNLKIHGAVLITGIMLISFCALILYAIIAGLDINCGCFTILSSEQSQNLWLVLFRNIALLLLTFLTYKQLSQSETKTDTQAKIITKKELKAETEAKTETQTNAETETKTEAESSEK